VLNKKYCSFGLNFGITLFLFDTGKHISSNTSTAHNVIKSKTMKINYMCLLRNGMHLSDFQNSSNRLLLFIKSEINIL
jgi:hypothetical protein